MIVQLEYINHLLQFFENISYYASIMLNAFSDLLCSELCWHNRLGPSYVANCKPAALGFLETLRFELFNYIFLDNYLCA